MGSRLVGMMSAQLPNVVLRVHTDGSFGDSAGSQPRGERAVALWMSEEQRSTASPERKTKAVPE